MTRDKQIYDGITIFMHWLTAIIVIGLFAVGLWMVDLNYYSQWYKSVPHWHKSVGISLGALTLFRLGWKQIQHSPTIQGARWEVVAAKITHSMMYLLLLGIFISGYLISTADGRAIAIFNWFEIPSMGELFTNQPDIAGNVHFYLACTLIGLCTLHALAALKHHFINKDNTLKKMLGVK